jgi:excisionase family DNA binding protein
MKEDPVSGQGSPTERVSVLPNLMDIQTIARCFGISVRQVRRFVAEGRIPFVRVGHLIRFDPDELNQWLDARRSGSTTQQ